MKTFQCLIILVGLLLTAVSAFVNFADVECGDSSIKNNRPRHRRIVNGDDATKGEFPWMVSIKLRKNSSHLCGGSLIHRNFVLTASHCVDYLKPSELEVSVGQLNIFRGVNYFKSRNRVWERRVHQIVLYPSFISSTTVSTGDIALLRLKPVRYNWNELVRPACLSDPTNKQHLASNNNNNSSPLTGQMATVIGWGRANDGQMFEDSSSTLQKVDLPILENEQCQLWYRDQGMVIKTSHLCAGFETGGKDSCIEDSGGPLMVKQDGRLVVVGLVSAGVGCGLPKMPGIYTRISSYIYWIKSVLAKKQE